MSEEKRPAKQGYGTIAGVALAAGLLVGAAGIYVTRIGSGNRAASAGCPANAALAEALATAAHGEVAAVAPVAAPFDVSAMAFKDGEGKPVSVADFAGKTLLVNLWATWCVPCRAEMPSLDALQRREGGEDFTVLPINVDVGSPDKPKAFYADAKLTALPFFRDETMGVFNDLKKEGVTIGLPVSLLVDPKGCARAAVAGPADWASPDGIGLIEAMKKNGKS